MLFYPIASSSSGNCSWIKTDKTSILIDCGVSLKFMKDALGNKRLLDLEAVFITHEHSDHIKSLGPFGRKYGAPIYINKLSMKKIESKLDGVDNINDLKAGEIVKIGDLEICPITTRHDSENAFGFMVAQSQTKIKLCYLTDTGSVTRLMESKILGSNILFIESDYDLDKLNSFPETKEEMVKTGDTSFYPTELKDRIKSSFGHLSNQQVMNLLKNLGIESLNKIILGHLSARTNSKELVEKAYLKIFPNHKQKLIVAPVDKPLNITNDKVEFCNNFEISR